MLRRLGWLLACLLIVPAGMYAWAAWRPLPLPQPTYAFDVKPGATLRSIAHELTSAGVIPAEWVLVALGRAARVDRSIKAGNYEIAAGTTLTGLLAKLGQGDATQSAFTIVEGWTFRDIREALKADGGVSIVVSDRPDDELMRRIGATEAHPEGLFFPDTYFFAKGATDASLLARAYRLMQLRLAAAWQQRAPDLPLASPYEALTLASIVEKETGRAADRPLIAAVFINRLKQGMRLQTDPAVIYGMGTRFDGTLHKRDLEADQQFNTYTREGLPPTPIAMPSLASLDAVLHPPASPYLYFVSRGDGSSEFSSSLADHDRAVAKYQKGGR
ncbi:MAG TPA: endolytic transglycosylase MltG [Casimicrobiaceae bacterium]|nr:endolytic transglycosylase MltG [Casimicrobiaceae bacterium]